MRPYELSGFADEISPSLSVQLCTLKRLGIPGLDLRSVDDVNVLRLTNEQLDRVASEAKACGIRIQCIGSPVNKVDFSPENHEAEMRKLRRSVEIAQRLGVERIRIFSPRTEDAEGALKAMEEMVRLAESESVVLLHENDADFWGAYPSNAQRLFDDLGGKNLRAAFDFANTVLLGFRPMNDWFPWLLPYLDTLHIKDARGGKVVPAGEGDGQIEETLRWLFEQNWHGTLTLEPHLAHAGTAGGFSGEAQFELAVDALRSVLSRAEGAAHC